MAKNKQSFQCIERFIFSLFLFVFSWDIQNHNWFRCVSFRTLFFSNSLWLSHSLSRCHRLIAYVVRHFSNLKLKNNAYVVSVASDEIRHGSFQSFLAVAIHTQALEMGWCFHVNYLCRTKKVYADGLQFKWFTFILLFTNFDSYQLEQVDDATALNVSSIFQETVNRNTTRPSSSSVCTMYSCMYSCVCVYSSKGIDKVLCLR